MSFLQNTREQPSPIIKDNFFPVNHYSVRLHIETGDQQSSNPVDDLGVSGAVECTKWETVVPEKMTVVSRNVVVDRIALRPGRSRLV